MSIAKEKMTSKRFIPILSDIPEEELYHTIDLGWDIPCARRGRRFSAISLKHENSRRAINCGGCPGCDSSVNSQKSTALIRSNSCKTCVSDDYKQRIVRKWLDEVPVPPAVIKPVKSVAVAKVSGTPRIIEPKTKNEEPPRTEVTRNDDSKHPTEVLRNAINDVFDEDIPAKIIETKLDKIPVEIDTKTTHTVVVPEKRSPPNHKSRRIRKKLPPPPPPPVDPPEPPKDEEADAEPIPPEVKIKMEAVIRELNKCRRVEPKELEDVKMETIAPIAPKIVIPVIAADSQYYSDDNLLADKRKKEFYIHRDNAMDFDSLERSMMRRRRFSLACEPELTQKEEYRYHQGMQAARERLSSSWRDLKQAVEQQQPPIHLQFQNKNEVFINTTEPLYDNLCKPGSLTIKVSGSPVETRRNHNEEFDPDTLDRKPKREPKKRVEKILLKSGGSFKFKTPENEDNQNKTPPEAAFTRKIGSLRQIYEAKTKVQIDDTQFYGRRGSIPFMGQEITGYSRALKTPDLIRQIESQKDHKPPIPPKQRRGGDLSPKFSNNTRDSPPDRRRTSEERDRFPSYSRLDNLNARRSGRRSARTRSRRTDLRKLYRTEDSGYMSTDSNESKRRANYLLQLRPKTILLQTVPTSKVLMKTPLQIESDTDDLESICDGRSESGGESVETDSVFFGNFDDTKELFAELGLSTFELQGKGLSQEQIDSGFMGETNIILSGDSDSEHRSVISIIAGRDGRASAASITKIEDQPYVHSVEC